MEQFKIGKSYSMTSVSDKNLNVEVKVLGRTDTSLIFKLYNNTPKESITLDIHTFKGIEYVKPLGNEDHAVCYADSVWSDEPKYSKEELHLLDQFAMATVDTLVGAGYGYKKVAQQAYRYAAAMIEERKKYHK